MNNPFDLENYQPQVSLRDVAQARKQSYQQTAVVNRRRAQGVEPNAVHLPGSRDDVPQRYVADMPVMPKYKKPSRSKKA